MPASKIQANYDELAQIRDRFTQRSDQVEQIFNKINSCVDQMQNGRWTGRGANAFFQEMQDLVFPGIQQLRNALQEASRVTQQASEKMRSAEEEASTHFTG
jgi:WXG100 family type VII secretion target